MVLVKYRYWCNIYQKMFSVLWFINEYLYFLLPLYLCQNNIYLNFQYCITELNQSSNFAITDQTVEAWKWCTFTIQVCSNAIKWKSWIEFYLFKAKSEAKFYNIQVVNQANSIQNSNLLVKNTTLDLVLDNIVEQTYLKLVL